MTKSAAEAPTRRMNSSCMQPLLLLQSLKILVQQAGAVTFQPLHCNIQKQSREAWCLKSKISRGHSHLNRRLAVTNLAKIWRVSTSLDYKLAGIVMQKDETCDHLQPTANQTGNTPKATTITFASVYVLCHTYTICLTVANKIAAMKLSNTVLDNHIGTSLLQHTTHQSCIKKADFTCTRLFVGLINWSSILDEADRAEAWQHEAQVLLVDFSKGSVDR